MGLPTYDPIRQQWFDFEVSEIYNDPQVSIWDKPVFTAPESRQIVDRPPTMMGDITMVMLLGAIGFVAYKIMK